MNRRSLFSLALAFVAMPFTAKAKTSDVGTLDEQWKLHYRKEPTKGIQRVWDNQTLVYSKVDVYHTLRGQYDFGSYEAFMKGRAA